MSRIILVTGANDGIGLELTHLLAEKGHTVYLGARNPAKGKEAQEKLASDGLKFVQFVELDVTKPETIKAAHDVIEAAEGKLDVLINNAAISGWGANQSASFIDALLIRDTMETNFVGLVQTTQVFLPLLRKSTTGAPVILNVSTGMGSNTFMANPPPHIYLPDFVAYNASKAAANSYTVALSKELKTEGFKVNAASPGQVITKINDYAKGGRTVREGATSLLPWALLDKDGANGKFFGWDGKEFPW